MYAKTGLPLPYLPGFPQVLHHHQHPLQEELLCRLQSNDGPLLNDNAGTTTITDYYWGGEEDLFEAPEPLIQDPWIELVPMTDALSMIPSCDDVLVAEAIKIADIDSLPGEQLLSEVLLQCEKDLLAESAVEDAIAELSDVKIFALQTEEEKMIEDNKMAEGGRTRDSIVAGYLASLEDACTKLSDVKIPTLQIEEKQTQNDKVVEDGSLQKSVSSGCLTSLDWINEGYMKPSFLGFQGLDLSAVFGMRRAYSDGDIQTLGDGNLGQVNTTAIHPPFERLLTTGDYKIEERREKLSRYWKKKSKRNFGRKIKYACRKALADSQPRVRGRFAKTEECETSRAFK